MIKTVDIDGEKIKVNVINKSMEYNRRSCTKFYSTAKIAVVSCYDAVSVAIVLDNFLVSMR